MKLLNRKVDGRQTSIKDTLDFNSVLVLQAHLYKGHQNIQKDDQQGLTLASKDWDEELCGSVRRA